jgi:mRNA-degrading endonuclease RelE of RelBE toxin-antitoxin system
LSFLDSRSRMTEQKCDWRFITAVGEIKSEESYLTDDGWYLPIKCAVSGLTKITNDPTILNSTLECSKISFSKNDSAIFVTVYKELIGAKSNDCRYKVVNIGKLKNAKYKVCYKFDNDTHLISMFDVSKILNKY